MEDTTAMDSVNLSDLDMELDDEISPNVRLIIYDGEAHPPLPCITSPNVDLWVVPRASVLTHEDLISTLNNLNALGIGAQFAIMIQGGFKIHPTFYNHYAKVVAAVYICIIHEDPNGLPTYTESVIQERMHILSDRMVARYRYPQRQYRPPTTRLHDSEILVVKTCFLNENGTVTTENHVLVRAHHTIRHLHRKLMTVYKRTIFPNIDNHLTSLRLQWGPENLVLFPSETANHMRVMDLGDVGANKLTVIPVFTPNQFDENVDDDEE